MSFHVVAPPPAGVYRVGRRDDPYHWSINPVPDLTEAAIGGNRFDSLYGTFGVCYFATDLEGCFRETLARYRPDPELADLVRDEWNERGFMTVGGIAKGWRDKRVIGHVALHLALPFLDFEHPETHRALEEALGSDGLAQLGYEQLDVGVMRGQDRRVTRTIADWAQAARNENGPMFAGIRYVSRLGDFECWAVFDNVLIAEMSRA